MWDWEQEKGRWELNIYLVKALNLWSESLIREPWMVSEQNVIWWTLSYKMIEGWSSVSSGLLVSLPGVALQLDKFDILGTHLTPCPLVLRSRHLVGMWNVMRKAPRIFCNLGESSLSLRGMEPEGETWRIRVGVPATDTAELFSVMKKWIFTVLLKVTISPSSVLQAPTLKVHSERWVAS